MNNCNLKFASCEDTIIHKMFAARARDLEDVRILVAKNYKKLNMAYITKWLKDFSKIVGRDLFRELIS